MYKNILVPVALDHERDTDAALAIAKHLCSKGGKITALYVMEDLPGYVSHHLMPDQLQMRRDDAERLLREQVGDDDTVSPVVITGHAGRSIVDFADDNAKDCIVMASHRPGLQDYLLGSTAARVVRHANCAVHVIR